MKDGERRLERELREYEDLCINEIISEAEVVCCTCVGAMDKVLEKNFKNFEFDIVVIDEAAQCCEIACWIPILRGKKLILAGDH